MHITPEWLLSVGARDTHWNQNYNGGYHEYWFPIYGEAKSQNYDSRISVEFGTYPEYGPYNVTIHASMCGLMCKHVKTEGQFKQLHYLITGRKFSKPAQDQAG